MKNESARAQLKNKQRIVIKIGSSSLVHAETGRLNLPKIEILCREVADLRNQGKDVVLVSSGAIAVGKAAMGLAELRTLKQKQACAAIGQNLSANLLGLGNAATPMGIRAVRRMRALSGSDTATDEMCRLIVMNTASIQLIPATVAGIRASLGAVRPYAILPAVWLTSAASVTAGLLAARLLERRT